jgi:hypothetical protein
VPNEADDQPNVGFLGRIHLPIYYLLTVFVPSLYTVECSESGPIAVSRHSRFLNTWTMWAQATQLELNLSRYYYYLPISRPRLNEITFIVITNNTEG